MAVWGEASYKVKRAITFRGRFTVAELVDATDLAYTQVEQVVQRLIKRGYVRPLEAHELKPAEQAAARRVGRPRKRYTLTEDPAKRGEFYAGVEAIASAERLSRAKERKPSTPHFNRAMQVIEAMERGAEPFSSARLEESADLLAYGRDFEGLIPEGAEIAQACYDRAQARLEAQRGDYPKAEELLAQAEDAFRAAGLDEQVQRSIDLKLALKVAQGLEGIKLLSEQQADLMPALEDLKSLVYDFSSSSSLLLPLQQSVEAFAAGWATVQEMQVAMGAHARPTSRYYLSARQLLDQAQTAEEPQRERLLSDAERDLEMAEQAGGGSLAPEPVKACLLYERARLAYLRGEYEKTKESFESLRKFFVGIHEEAMVRRIDESRACLEADRRFAAEKPDSVSEVDQARCLLDTLDDNAYQTDSPLILRLLRLLHKLSETADEKTPAEVFKFVRHEVRVGIAEAFRFEKMRLPYKIDRFRQGERQPPPDWQQKDEPRPSSPEDWLSKSIVGHQLPRQSRHHTHD